MASVLVNGQIQKLQNDVLDLSGGLNQNLAQVLTNGNQTGGQLIDAQGGNIICDAMKCISIEAATAPLFNEIAVDADFGMSNFAEIKYQGNLILRNNQASLGSDVIIDAIPVAGISLPNVVSYDTSTNKLYYQPAGGGGVSNPLTSNLNAGNYMITNANDIQTNSIFISKDTGISGGQPRIEFQDNTGYAKAQVGWNASNDLLTAGSNNISLSTYNDQFYLTMKPSDGYTELLAKDAEIHLTHQSSGTTDTTFRVLASGVVSVGRGDGTGQGAIFVEGAGGNYGTISYDNGSNSLISSNIKPSQIIDITNVIGSAGNYLSKDGGNNLSWTASTPGTWAPTAMSDLNMNQFQINNVPIINVERPNTSGNPTINFIDTTSSTSVALDVQPSNGQMYATNVQMFQVWTGAVEGVQMGVNNSVGYENYFRGMGLPLRISQSQTDESTTYMLMDSGSINLTANSQINMTATDKVVVSNPTGNSTEFVLQQSNPSILGGGSIIADAGSGEFVFKGAGDGTVTVVRGATFTSIQALAPDAVISNAVGGGEVITELSADGSGKGKIYMKAETSSSPSEFTVDGTTGSGVITAKSNQLVLDINGSVGTAGQALISNGTSAIWSDNPAVWGSFLNTGNVNISTPNLATAIPHNTTTVSSNCALSGGSIVVQKACSKLRIQSSLLASPTANNTTFRFWLFKSPANVPNSQSIVSLKSVADKALCVCEWYVSSVVGDVFTILCEADNASTIYAEAGTGSRPACPSIITTLMGFA